MTAAAALEIRGLVKDYLGPDGNAIRVIALPELTVPAGGELVIVGPSGSGKTTLLNLVAGLLLPTAGQVRILGREIGRLGEAERDRFRARRIGYVFQSSNLLAGFSALENVMLAMGFAAVVPPRERRRRARQLLEAVGLGDRLDHRPGQLSSGQQQRVAVARALANRPSLVLADEPTAHIDFAMGRQVVALLRSACAERGAALLLATHDREVAASFERSLGLGSARSVGSDQPAATGPELLAIGSRKPQG